jgi:hypothetical protein
VAGRVPSERRTSGKGGSGKRGGSELEQRDASAYSEGGGSWADAGTTARKASSLGLGDPESAKSGIRTGFKMWPTPAMGLNEL